MSYFIIEIPEEILEDLALAPWISDAQEEPALDPEAAKEYYNSLDKAL
ncbi:MAG TPA: hypothetical protein VN493_19755 [Thermoanaerobaculia bacterium]|nr:hypothetical protein [Thermoanaerobaculia bacterium]